MDSPIESYDPSRYTPIKKISVLGKGSYGVVHLAHFEGREKYKFAMKSADRGEEEDALSLEKEKRIYESLHGCVGITGCFMDATTQDPDDDGLTYYSLMLEYAPAGTLSDLILKTEGSGFSERQVISYARQILLGLANMHGRGYVHCDLKPENILAFPGVNDPHELKLADFGLAEEPDDRLPAYYWKGRWRGTPSYMSPESVNEGFISWSLDIWSLGCVVLQMLDGCEALWSSERDGPLSAVEIRDMLGDPEFDPMDFVPESTSEAGKSFLRKCLEKDPVKRWPAHRLLNHRFLLEERTLWPDYLNYFALSCFHLCCFYVSLHY